MDIIGKFIKAKTQVEDGVIITESNDSRYANYAQVLEIGDEVENIEVGDFIHISDLDGEHLDKKYDPSIIIVEENMVIMKSKTPCIRIIEELSFYKDREVEKLIVI